MSIDKKEEKPIEETKDEKPIDVVGDNVALLKSKIITLEALGEDLTNQLDEVNGKYEQAKEFIDNDAKAELLSYISPRYSLPKELLMLKTVDELKDIKEHINKVEVPAFKAGTPISTNKTSQRALLESTFDREQAKRVERSK